MIICEHCAREIEPIQVNVSVGGSYGDTYATNEWTEQSCPECGADCETVEVEDELDRRYFRRFGKTSGLI